jgi:hypothetical protein
MSNAYAADCYSTFDRQGYRNRSGSLAIFAAILGDTAKWLSRISPSEKIRRRGEAR